MNASFSLPSDVIADGNGNVFICDQYNNRIREILATPPSFNVTANSLTFSAASGGVPSQPKLFTVNSAIPGLLFAVSATTASGGSWLNVTPSAGASPRLVEVSANPANLAPGTYQGTIMITSANAFPRIRTIEVTFTVAVGPAPSLSVDKGSISFTFPKSGTPRSEVFSVGNGGSGTLDFTASAATSIGGNWLRLSPALGRVSPVAPSVLAVTADPTGLAPGTYAGEVTISAANGDARTVSVSMTVSEAEKSPPADANRPFFLGGGRWRNGSASKLRRAEYGYRRYTLVRNLIDSVRRFRLAIGDSRQRKH